ncbi:sulfatase/phosphatase domain-containing protein [Flavobacterium fluviatile]|uniref:sulfatase/phosphatase domain-containing protein n=1 Tax=Flavobacterium fluviatile TaxID=1862387 RepID=UPI001AD73E59|nr:sulfatase/phosphatase domain-containing protein [Flavobacterium fluviatile]
MDKYGKRSVQDYLHHPEFELFDLRNDPDETKNLATDKNYTATLEVMKKSLKEFQKKNERSLDYYMGT